MNRCCELGHFIKSVSKQNSHACMYIASYLWLYLSVHTSCEKIFLFCVTLYIISKLRISQTKWVSSELSYCVFSTIFPPPEPSKETL